MCEVRVVSNSISFGCMKGIRRGDGQYVSILLYDNLIDVYTPFVPEKNDLLLCELYHSSLYIPVGLVVEEHRWLYKLAIPDDILYEYFPLLRSYKCAA